MMIKKLLILLFVPLLTTSVIAETVAYKLKGDLKSKGSEAIEVSATSLINSKEIKRYKEQLITIVKYANNQSNEVAKKNENRKPRPKYKGGPEEIFEKFANSVVYIAEQVWQRLKYHHKGKNIKQVPAFGTIDALSLADSNGDFVFHLPKKK